MSTHDGRAARRLRTRLVVHLFVVGLVLANCAWILADELKRLAVAHAPSPVLDWATIFHNPADAALLPYVASALAAFGWGLFLYVRLRPPAGRFLRALRRAACARNVPLLVVIAAGQAFLVAPAMPGLLRGGLAAVSLAACLVRLPARAASGGRALLARLRTSGVALFCLAGSAGLLVAMAMEPVKIALRPVRLLNEYAQLAERPLADADAPAERERPAANRGCEFSVENPLECELQSKARGQVNHVGHVLNAVNEVETGKPIDRTYFQYGLGATFVLKWVMDAGGGVSLQAWYKSLLLFVAYWLVFAAAALVLARDARHLLAAMGLLAATHYALGYEALLLAPGINPVLHFLDLPVLVALSFFFRAGRKGPLALAAAGAAGAVALNALFGTMAVVALCVSAGMYVLEDAPAGRRAPRLLALAALVAVALGAVVLALPRTGGESVRAQFLVGFFSFEPPASLVLAALAYLGGSYLFLVWARGSRDPLKYAVVYLFVYAQGFLLYCFWSGLESHFWPVLPYVGLQALLMLRLLARTPWGARREPSLLLAAMLGIALLVESRVDGFVAERNAVRRLFARWETHAWPFERARVVATADPAPIAASLAQIERYAGPSERGLCILSVFDNLLPFLAGRHSIFPHFDLQWALVTEADHARAVDAARAARPRYVFVGREVEGEVSDAGDGCPDAYVLERRSARARVRELGRVFRAISADYERVEAGPLLSVYRRRDGSS